MADAVVVARLRREFADLVAEHFTDGTPTAAGMAVIDSMIAEYGQEALWALVAELQTPTVRPTDCW
ncbi:hypothetical protein [Streptomyces sp. NPDC051183]|uniref:hypothetical protein n=1 Tax=Streptomyces sp. NPDC051183 TaxID=3155165 RepID=UPI003434FC86